MARKALKSDAPLNPENKNKVLEAVGDLLETHGESINKAIEDSDDRKLTVNFAVEIDASDTAPSIDVKCRFTPCTITDKRSLKCDDPKQGTLNMYTPEEMAKREEKAKAEAEKAEKAKAQAEKAAKKAADKAADKAAKAPEGN